MRRVLTALAQTALLMAMLPLIAPAAAPASPGEEEQPEAARYDVERYWWNPRFDVGRYYRVVAHFPWEGLLESAKATADAAWPVASDLYGVDPAPPEEPYNIHLFRDRELFDRACRALTGRTWPDNDGLTDRESGVSLVVVGAGLGDDAFLDGIGLSLKDRLLIAHEASHLLATYRVPGDRNHPAWLSEGIAQHVARRVVVAERHAPSLEEDPVRGRTLRHLQDLQQAGQLPGASSILQDEQPAITPFHRYGLYEAFVDFLVVSRRGELASSLAAAEGLEEAEAVRASLARSLLGEDGAALERDFRGHLAGQRSLWQLGGGTLSVAADGWNLAARRFERGVLWNLDGIHEASYALGGSLVLPDLGQRQRHMLYFGRADGRQLELLFDTDSGLVLDLVRGDEKRELARSEVELQPGSELHFLVEVEQRQVTIYLGSEVVLAITLDEGEGLPVGQWGVGSDLGSWGAWRKVGRRGAGSGR